MKKIDLAQPLKNIEGKVEEQRIPVTKEEIIDGEMTKNVEFETMILTLGKLLVHCLFQNSSELTEEELLQRMDLLDKVYEKDEAEFSDDEISLLKSLVIKKYDVFYAGSVVRILNK